jgi:hypothetical protein
VAALSARREANRTSDPSDRSDRSDLSEEMVAEHIQWALREQYRKKAEAGAS